MFVRDFVYGTPVRVSLYTSPLDDIDALWISTPGPEHEPVER